MVYFLLLVVVLILLMRRPNRDAYMQGYSDAKAGLVSRYEEVNNSFTVEESLETLPVGASTQTSVKADQADIYLAEQQLVRSKTDKNRENLRNLNIILYVASFLFVAAAAALIASSVPVTARLAGLVLVVALFYAGGMILHAKSQRLRPAAAAFIGTSLAILPFVGIALTMLGGVPGEFSWLVISIIGIAAYAAAAVALQSQLVSYLSLAFVISFALSSVASLQMPLVWYFTILIGLATVARLIAFLKPSLLPELFRDPIDATGQWVAPLALGASLFVIPSAPAGMYEIIFGLTTAHYMVNWLLQKTYLYETIVRVLLHCTLLIVIANQLDQVLSTEFGVWWLALVMLQVAYSTLRLRQNHTHKIGESSWLGVQVPLLFIGMLFWLFSDSSASLVCLSLLSIVTVGGAAVYGTRNWLWSMVSTFAIVPLLLVAARSWAIPPIDWEIIISLFAVLFIGGIWWRATTSDNSTQKVIASRLTSGLYAIVLIALGLQVSVLAAFWVFAIVGIGLVVASYIERLVSVELIGSIALLISLAFGMFKLLPSSDWHFLSTVVVGATGLLIGMMIHHRRGEWMRRNGLLVIAAAVGMTLVTLVGHSSESVRSTGVVLLLASAFIVFGVRQIVVHRFSDMAKIMVITYHAYPVSAVLLASTISAGWLSLALLATAVIFWIGSYSEKAALMMLAGNIAFVGAVAALWSALSLTPQWELQAVSWISAAVFYGLYWVAVVQRDTMRETVQLYSAISILALLSLVTFFSFDSEISLAAAGTLVVAAAMKGVDGYRRKDKISVEIAVYAGTIGLQRAVAVLIPEVNFVAYAHWWALTILFTTWWLRVSSAARYMIAAGCITLSVGVAALGLGGWYTLLFLLEHLAFLLLGALLNHRWLLWWGVAASVAAIMYFLRDYVFLWLGLLGLVLIVVVIWRLNKSGQTRTL